MTLNKNHHVKLLRGFGLSITTKENQIILKNLVLLFNFPNYHAWNIKYIIG
jgi:hypothetical protein